MNDDSITKLTADIIHKVEETKDDFIFTTIMRWAGYEHDISRIIMSKQILCRALICFKEEHTDEYFKLLDESIARTRKDEVGDKE